MSEGQQADKKGYVEYRAHIPKDVYAKLHYLKVHYQLRSVNEVILRAIKEFLENHEEDLTSSSAP